MRKAATIGAGIAIVLTGMVGALALLDVEIPVVGYLLYPGGMAAWAYKGDNYTSETFLRHMVVFAVVINTVAGMALGLLIAWITRLVERTNA